MRVFIAIDFNNGIKAYIKEKQNEIRTYCNKGNFTHQDNFHLTIVFIGEADVEEIKKIKKAMDDTTKQCEEFTINLSHFDFFQRQGEYIPWIGIDGELSKLNNLYHKLYFQLKSIGFSLEERSLKPHITLGRRIQFNKSVQLIKKNILIDKLNIQICSIVLMESKRINNRLIYKPLYEKKLKSRNEL